jgi:hypothetical protein
MATKKQNNQQANAQAVAQVINAAAVAAAAQAAAAVAAVAERTDINAAAAADLRATAENVQAAAAAAADKAAADKAAAAAETLHNLCGCDSATIARVLVTEQLRKQAENRAAAVAAAKAAERGAATYCERMQVNKELLVNNLSQLLKRVKNGSLIPCDCLRDVDFKHFRAYMIERHKLSEGETPKRGWSVWYALQYCEKQVKAAAAKGNAQARNYLLNSRAELQSAANRLF